MSANRICPVGGDFEEAAALEVDAGEAVAVAITPSGVGNNVDFVYSATAEDNGTAGELDAQPGLVASGLPEGITVPVRVKVTNLDLAEGTIAPEASDTVTAIVAVNSERVLSSDEGFQEADAVAEHNIDGVVYVKNNDVVRVAVLAAADSEDALDIDVAEGGVIALH